MYLVLKSILFFACMMSLPLAAVDFATIKDVDCALKKELDAVRTIDATVALDSIDALIGHCEDAEQSFEAMDLAKLYHLHALIQHFYVAIPEAQAITILKAFDCLKNVPKSYQVLLHKKMLVAFYIVTILFLYKHILVDGYYLMKCVIAEHGQSCELVDYSENKISGSLLYVALEAIYDRMHVKHRDEEAICLKAHYSDMLMQLYQEWLSKIDGATCIQLLQRANPGTRHDVHELDGHSFCAIS